MAARGVLEQSVREGGSNGSGSRARADMDLLLHPELLSQEFLLLTLEQKNIPVEEEVKVSKEGLTDLYVQHVIPLPQRNLPNSRWGKVMEKKRSQKVLKYVSESSAAVENLRKRPLIVFDGSSTSTSIKIRKTENGAVDRLKLLISGSTSTTCRRLSDPSDSSTSASASILSQDVNEAKKNNIIINKSNMTSSQKMTPLVPATGPTVVKLKRTAPKEESDAANGLRPTEAKKKIQHVTWP
ncbi:ashwin [Eublepharis macularius]|uniref:Ashwin n=1 Tax=Eublepharis macularius TaxID=481883 RepID=A0AA97J193_EUBMA|nr:ashwin [Eublepharis macularius]XP_054829557.1 ashwin [Eublepharis macularius]XP_054829558.1 ashwin [Eublepharis macularius]